MNRPAKRLGENASSTVPALPPEESSDTNRNIPVGTSSLSEIHGSNDSTNPNSSSLISTTSYVTTGGPRTLSNTPTAVLRSHIPETVDVFGFAIPPGQFLLIQLVATLMLGFHGSIIFLLVWIAYTIFHRVTSTQQRSGNNNRTGGSSFGRQSGSNIRGMKDLPKPPPKGG